MMIENLLLCVGAQKAGTTWLHSQLEHHPDIGFPGVKEVHYFNTIHRESVLLVRRKIEHLEKLIKNNRTALERYFVNLSLGKPLDKGIQKLLGPVNDEWYTNLYKGMSKKYAADFSPEYALLPDAGFENIKRVSRSQKIIFIMRDPVSRAKSAIRYFYEGKGIDIRSVKAEELERLALSNLILDMSRYEVTIEKLNQHFDRSNLLYLFYENLIAQKQETLDSILTFLDVAPMMVPLEKLDKKVNATNPHELSRKVDEVIGTSLSETYRYVHRNFSVPAEWKSIN